VLIISKISVLSLISLSQEYIAAGAQGAAYYQASGALALAVHYWISEVILVIFFALGALLFYYLVYQSKLLPRFIPIWGFIAIVSLIAGNTIEVPNETLIMLLLLPIMLNEVFIGIWLLVKGFKPSSTILEPA
jgi:hypothetical protein